MKAFCLMQQLDFLGIMEALINSSPPSQRIFYTHYALEVST